MRTKPLKAYSTRTTVEDTIWETRAKTREEEVVTDGRKEDLFSKEDVFDAGHYNIRCENVKPIREQRWERRGDPTYRGNSGYGRRFHQSFQMTSKSMDNE